MAIYWSASSYIGAMFMMVHVTNSAVEPDLLNHTLTTEPSATPMDMDTSMKWTVKCPIICSCIKTEPSASYVFQIHSNLVFSSLMKAVNCSNGGFDKIPRKIPKDTEIIVLNNNNFYNIQKLPYIPSVVFLDLSNNSIESVDSNYLFLDYKKLLYLTLNNNNLETLVPGTFRGLSNLVYLDLSYNKLTNISSHALSGLENLQGLNLRGNLFTRIYYPWFQDVPNLRELDLSFNSIKYINNKDFYPLHDLNLLNLSNNRIKKIDNIAFKELHNLFILDLTHNNMYEIPVKSVQVLHSLKKLTFDGNPINKIQKRDFSGLNITSLSISYMQDLVFIETLAFQHMPSLISIEAHDNPKLIYIDGHAFQDVPNLQNLYIHNNQLSALSPSIIQHAPSLVTIHMYHNPLRCDCNAFWVRELIQEVKVKNQSKPYLVESEYIKCDFPLNLTGISVGDVDENQFDRVCGPTTLPSFKENYTLDLGQELRLECHSFGVPEPHLTWLLPNGSAIDKDFQSEKFEIIDNCVLIIRHLTTEDSGTYMCKSENGLGSDISSTRIKVTNKPVRLLLYTVSSSYVKLSWNGTQHIFMISDYQLHYREIKGDYSINSSLQTSLYRVIPLGPQYHSYTVTQLQPDTLYEFCIVYVYDTELYKVDCLITRTKVLTKYHNSAIKKIVSEKIIAGVCTALGLILAVACMVTMVKKFRFHKLYDTSYDTDESETINIPMENVYQPLSMPLCSSKTSLLSSNTRKPAFDEY